MDKWYWFLLVGFGIIILLMWVKLSKNKKKEYYSEIKYHHDKVEDELRLNLSSIGYLYQKGKCLGKVKGLATKIIEKPKTKRRKTKEGTETEILLEREKYYVFSLATKGYWIFRYGSEHLLIPQKFIKFDWAKKRMQLDNDISLEYFLGYFVPSGEKPKIFTHSEFYRTLMDKSIDGMGTQMLKFSEVKDEWAFAIAMKQKDIERVEAEKKLMGTRAR